MAAQNLARMAGVVVVSDSQHRDRWGVDGYHPEYVVDGNTEGDGERSRTSSWASDNWELTHALALIFPRRVEATQVAIHWAKPGDTPLTPKSFVVQGRLGDRWHDVAEVSREEAEPVTRVEFGPSPLDAIGIVQPPDGVSSAADLRLWIAEFAVTGSPVDPLVAVDTGALRTAIDEEFEGRRAREDAARVAPALARVMERRKTRGCVAIIDGDDIARGRRNAASRPWAKDLAERIVKDADWWTARDDDEVYALVPEGNPRALCPSFEKGCPIHGGARSTFRATLEAPYRWVCSKGGEEWYDGAVIANPTTGQPVTVHDDGDGWLAPEGFLQPGLRYTFVAAYRYFLIGKLFSSPYEPDGGSAYQGGTPVLQLALAYALTGESRYAHTCAVMLNRLAELYRTYDGCIEGPSQRQDGYIGQTFERFLVQNLILACDLIWDSIEDDADLHRLFAAKGNADYDGDGTVTPGDFTHNLQRNLLGFIYEYLHRLMPYMDGDFLMYEMTALAALAHCLENPAITAEALESDLGLRVLLTNSWFRDGKFIYDSCGYNVGNARTPLLIAEWMHGLAAPPRYAESLDLYHHPEYRMGMLFDFLRQVDCDGRGPPIGDGGGSRDKILRLTPVYDPYDERGLLRLPEHRDFYASRLLASAGGELEQVRRGHADWWLLFHAEDALESSGSRGDSAVVPPASHLFDDSGIAILRAGSRPETRQHVCLTFSKGAYGHGHADKLAINILRYGYDFSADLGYPTTWTDIKCGGWEKNTASHCTVMLDEQGQRGNVTGRFGFLLTQPGCDVVEASAEAAYPDATLYRRTVALVRDDQGDPLYTADIFRVAGADIRDYLFHSLGKPEDLTVELGDGATAWTAQAKGSLAGEEIPPMTRGGYGFLFDVQRAPAPAGIKATWRPTTGSSQPDRYLLTRRAFGECTVRFTLTRTGRASGTRERALFAFSMDPTRVADRRVAWLDAGGQLPVGKAVDVRIEVVGATATVFLDGKPTTRGVDTAGRPGDSGSVGFLHYYNYAYEYRDLVIVPKGGEAVRIDLTKPLDPDVWERMDPTYEAAAGVLSVCDYEAVGLRLHMPGAPGREVIRAKAEGYGVRGQSPFEGHVIVRDRVANRALATAFTGVLEAEQGTAGVVHVESIPVPSRTNDPSAACDMVALRVVTLVEGDRERVDYVLSAMGDTTDHVIETSGGPIRFRGRFGLVTTRGGEVGSLTLCGGGHLQYGGKTLQLPGSVRGEILGTEPESDSIVVRLDRDSPAPAETIVGRKLSVTDEAFACPAVYTIVASEDAGAGTWRFRLNLPLAVARGAVLSVDPEAGRFATRTPLMKLRVNPGLFDGKWVGAAAGGMPHRLRTAREEAFVLREPGGIRDFRPGEDYIVYDIGLGDRIEVIPQATAE